MNFIRISILKGILLSVLVLSVSYSSYYLYAQNNGSTVSSLNTDLDLFEWAGNNQSFYPLYTSMYGTPTGSEYPKIGNDLYHMEMAYHYPTESWYLKGDENHALNNSDSAEIESINYKYNTSSTMLSLVELLKQLILNSKNDTSSIKFVDRKVESDINPYLEFKKSNPSNFTINFLQIQNDSSVISIDFREDGILYGASYGFYQEIYNGKYRSLDDYWAEGMYNNLYNLDDHKGYSISYEIKTYYFIAYNNYNAVLSTPYLAYWNNTLLKR